MLTSEEKFFKRLFIPTLVHYSIALLPLTTILRKMNKGYQMENVRVNHLLYMDDLKLQARSNKEIESLVKTVRIFSDDVHMQFGLDKCAKVKINRGKLASMENIRLPSREEIRELEIEETYKYLGIHQADEVRNNVVKEKTQSEYQKRLRLIVK